MRMYMNTKTKYRGYYFKILPIALSIIILLTCIPSMSVSAATWTDYLNEKADEQTSAFRWDESITDPAKIWDGTSAEITNIDADGYYLASTPSEFRWALEQSAVQSTAINVRLTADIDLGGRNGVEWTPIAKYTGNIDGAGHAINNLYITGKNFITDLSANSSIKNIEFNNFKINTTLSNDLGLVGTIHANTIFENIHINNSYLSGYGSEIALLAAYHINGSNVTFNKIYIKNSTLIARSGQHHGMLIGFGTVNYGINLTNSFAIDSTLISYGSHSGGFMGCAGVIANSCFANLTVYGNVQTSAFAGSTGLSTFENCYVTGKVEGTSTIAGWSFGASSIKNCYSTAMVGMQNGGTNISGMANNNTGFGRVTYADCYVAGEVGGLSTPVNNTLDTITAFASNPASAVNCYYDKQITGMREDGEEKADGIKGVLTRDKTHGGTTYTGLTSAPGVNGFTGFSDNTKWVYTEGLYPQLSVFANADPNIWGDEADTVKAYSLASVQTLYLDNYERKYDNTEAALNTYDTVRDITSPISSSNGSWRKGYNTDGTFTDKTTTVNGKVYDILTMETIGATQYITDFAPGIEWMQVTADVNGATGSRIMRLCPTVNLDAGIDASVAAGDTYDHRDDVTLAYATTTALSNNTFEFEGSYNTATNTSPVLNSSPAQAIDQVLSQTGHNIRVFVYQFGFNDLSPDTKFSFDDLTSKLQNGTEVTTPGILDQQFTGNTPLSNGEKGRHMLEYIWELPDGRSISNRKMVFVRDVPIKIQANVVHDLTQDAAGNNLDDASVYLGSSQGSTAAVGGTLTAQSSVLANYQQPATISWQIPEDPTGNPLRELAGLTIKTGTDYTEWIDGIYNSQTQEITAVYRNYTIVKDNITGIYEVVTNEGSRVYPIEKTGNTYKVTFDFLSNIYQDVSEEVIVNLQFRQLNDYTIIYDTGDGSAVANKTGLVFDSQESLIPAAPPVKDGYTFIGWDYQGTAVTDATKYRDLVSDSSVKEITLVAQWQPNNYTVKYDSGFNDITIADKTNVTWGDSNLLPTPPAKDGYTFIGWDYQGTTVTDASKYMDLAADPSLQEITLVAQWEENKYTIKYDSGFGNIIIADKTDAIWGDSNLLPPPPAKDGYTFVGWNYQGTMVTDTTKYMDLVADSSLQEITLVAQWKPNKYTVDYQYISTNNPNVFLPPIVVEYGTIMDQPTLDIPQNWIFDGWYVDEALSQKYDFTQAVTSNITLYGKWINTVPQPPSMSQPDTAPGGIMHNNDSNGLNVPQTGDSSAYIYWISFGLAVSGIAIICVIRKQKHNKS